MTIRTSQLKIDGMYCQGCEEIIVDAVMALPGVQTANASYRRQLVDVRYDDNLVDEPRICEQIGLKGYQVLGNASARRSRVRQALIFLLLMVLVGGVAFWGKSLMPELMKQINPQMNYALLLSIGFLTGFHCIGMCGGFVVGYTDSTLSKFRQSLAHIYYGFGKTLSYAALGAGFGFLGAAIAITAQMRGLAALAASVFLVLYGLRMLNVFAVLRRFALKLPMTVNRRISGGLRRRRSPLVTGLLSGLLLGCGPLQAMYVMAAGNGDPVQGGIMLMLFGLGTLLPLLGFGMFATLLSPKAMRQLMSVSGILVIAMGVMMAQRGLKIMQPNQSKSMMTQPIQKSY